MAQVRLSAAGGSATRWWRSHLARGPATGRGFSLIELMVAVAVLIVIGALAAPSLTSITDSSRIKGFCDQLSSVMSVTRADAKRRGVPLAVMVVQGSNGRTAIVSSPVDDAAQGEALGKRDEKARSGARQVLMEVPLGFRVTLRSADESAGKPGAASESGSESRPAGPSAEPTAPISLVVFMANGGASVEGPMVIRGPAGYAATATVNTWTGSLEVAELTEATDGEPEAEESNPETRPESKPEPAVPPREGEDEVSGP